MSYTKPGVEITQVQKTAQPILNAPDMVGCIIGEGLWWQDPTWDDSSDAARYSIYSAQYENSELEVAISSINSVYTDVVDGTVIVDLLVTEGDGAGTLTPLTTDQFSYAGGTITVNASLLTSGSKADVRVGFMAHNASVKRQFGTLTAISDIRDVIGEPVSWNPLSYGLYLAMINSGTEVSYVGVSGVDEAAFNTALEDLGSEEVYAIAPMSHLADPTAYKTHVTTQSATAGKKERIAIMNNEIAFTGTAHAETSVQKTATAEGIRDTNSAKRSKRLFMTHPDIGFVEERRHISTVHPTWIEASLTRYTSIDFAADNTYGLYAQLAQDIKLSGALYKKGTKVTATLWATLKAAGWADPDGMVTVLAPVPGYYYAAETVGVVIGTSPSQPLTNLAIGNMKRTYGSQDYFTETQLNTMAEGGTMIFTQDAKNSPVYCRHQLSTDVSSIAKRELSITTALDYTAKFMRLSLQPYIGSSNITSSFLTLVNTILVGIGLYLVREEILADFTVVNVEQDSINPDVLNVDVSVLPLYPSNYIKIRMVF